ncbi:MAG: hypothetical protein NTY20_01275 [Candidatus Aenigmarchaeota archaeon]|nr:hypothetical protein [Candidatus Aenigmarchaeota archaeon]
MRTLKGIWNYIKRRELEIEVYIKKKRLETKPDPLNIPFLDSDINTFEHAQSGCSFSEMYGQKKKPEI